MMYRLADFLFFFKNSFSAAGSQTSAPQSAQYAHPPKGFMSQGAKLPVIKAPDCFAGALLTAVLSCNFLYRFAHIAHARQPDPIYSCCLFHADCRKNHRIKPKLFGLAHSLLRHAD